MGYAPANYVEMLPAEPAAAAAAAPPGAYAVVQWDYTAQHGDELTVKAGDAVYVLSENNNGWWMAQLASDSSKKGLVPHNYLNKTAVRPSRACLGV